MDHDAAHKYIHSLPEVTADLLRLVVPNLVDELDLPTLEDRSRSIWTPPTASAWATWLGGCTSAGPGRRAATGRSS